MRPYTLITASLLIVLLAGEALAQSQSDTKLWLEAVGKVDLTETIRLDVEQELRLDDAWTGYEKTLTEIGVRFDPKDYLRLSAYYRFILADEVQQRIAGDVELSYDISDLELSYRLRLQSTTSSDGTRTYVRNKVKGSYEDLGSIEPFAAVEVHYLTTNSEFRELRYYLGVSWKLSKRMDIDGFYMYQDEFNVSIPEQNHIIGVGVSYEFRRVTD